jgi:16S rRNA processing protein RimM
LRGELTVRVAAGDATLWKSVREMWLELEGRDGALHDVESARAYGDRLVLKLRGIDDASAAAALRGARVLVPAALAPRLPEGVYYRAALVGLRVIDETGGSIGEVEDVVATKGSDLLLVRRAAGGDEILIPVVPEIVREVSERDGTITVRVPEGLLDLDRSERDDAAGD